MSSIVNKTQATTNKELTVSHPDSDTAGAGMLGPALQDEQDLFKEEKLQNEEDRSGYTKTHKVTQNTFKTNRLVKTVILANFTKKNIELIMP